MSNEQPRILIVDDDDLNLDVLIECLKDEPYELVQAHDGVQALDLLRHDRKGFEAMVLDRMMPGMNGLEVMTELKADENFKWIPVVMQTSAASPSEICEGMEAGVFFYLLLRAFDGDVHPVWPSLSFAAMSAFHIMGLVLAPSLMLLLLVIWVQRLHLCLMLNNYLMN